ncbi:MAG: hypothetical protein ACF8R7_16325 [Phycisphaerales bacterium JB039]
MRHSVAPEPTISAGEYSAVAIPDVGAHVTIRPIDARSFERYLYLHLLVGGPPGDVRAIVEHLNSAVSSALQAAPNPSEIIDVRSRSIGEQLDAHPAWYFSKMDQPMINPRYDYFVRLDEAGNAIVCLVFVAVERSLLGEDLTVQLGPGFEKMWILEAYDARVDRTELNSKITSQQVVQ